MTDPDRRLSERLHGIADHSMAVTIGNMVQETITELKKRESPGYPGRISFTLTDAEREAIKWAKGQAKLFPEFEAIRGHAEALLGLLERLG